MSTSVASVISHFPDAENGFTTTTAGSVGSGATTVTLNSVGGYTNGMPVVLVIDPTDASKKQTFTGIVDTAGVQITSVVWTAGTNQTHSLGATVVDYATATHIAMISKGLLVEHKQTGKHSAITADSLVIADAGTLDVDTINEATTAAGVTIDGMPVKDKLVIGGAAQGVNNLSLDTTAGDLGGNWLAFTPAWANLTEGSGTNAGAYTKIGKTVHFRASIKFAANTSISGAVTLTLPVATNKYTGLVHTIGHVYFFDSGTNAPTGVITSDGVIARYLLSGSNILFANISSTTPFTWTTNDEINVTGTYEIS